MNRIILAAAFAGLLAAPALAQQSAPAQPPAQAKPDTGPAILRPSDRVLPPHMRDQQKQQKSLDCSKEADAKGLHGKARKKFRSECKKG